MLRHMPIEFDETKHPRGQPDNAGKFKSKPVPTPPKATPRRRQPWGSEAEAPTDDGASDEPDPAQDGFDLSDEPETVALGFAWDEIHLELADPDADDGASDEPDPDLKDEEWRGVNCADCGQPMGASDNEVMESLTYSTRLGVSGRAVVVDAGLDPHAHRGHIPAVPVCVIRTCYLALSRAQSVPGPYERIVVIQEPGRGLRTRDIASALGADEVEVIAWDPKVGRSVDAGTIVQMLPPQLKRGLDGVVGLYGASAA